MKKVSYILNAVLFIGIVIIFVMSYTKKEFVEEELYINLSNYDLIYKDDRTFDVNLFCNKKESEIIYEKENQYYLVDYNEDLIFKLEILDINIYHKDTNYQYNLMFKIPKLNNDYKIEKAYLKIINQNSNYKGFLGKFNVLFETRKDTLDISISNLMGVFIERDGILTLDEIEISIDVATDKEVRILNSLFLKEPIIIALESNKENKIKLKLDEYDYYLNSTYFYIIHEDEMFLLDNYIYGINDMSYEGFFNNLSIMKKQKTND